MNFLKEQKINNAESSIRLVEWADVDKKNYTFRGVDCVVLTHDHKIILQKRGDNWNRFPGYIASFGGQIEMGETPIQALIRELHEELGAKVEERDVISLGVVTEAVTNHSELIYVYFWYDKYRTITGCYEGKVKHYDNIEEIFKYPKVMDDTKWALSESKKRGLI
jgi:8-oxo-dGTP diphosphatase